MPLRRVWAIPFSDGDIFLIQHFRERKQKLSGEHASKGTWDVAPGKNLIHGKMERDPRHLRRQNDSSVLRKWSTLLQWVQTGGRIGWHMMLVGQHHKMRLRLGLREQILKPFDFCLLLVELNG
ncbi:hypothetical protein C5Y96_22885 [Blastopirellula marina]|uniref:Uncharacterized protein n=1 Tax=Blastopirellula marina TaxID=124 RepID=A0A2S8F0K6_9BACT|nr:hypothetical protein C5Y96_22885 [Blastopirellula marina]RCS43353.1 hypothetical protein DTL36_22935 [Bremerella cremea]